MKEGRIYGIARIAIAIALVIVWYKEIFLYWKAAVSFILLLIYLLTLNIVNKKAQIAVFSAILAAVLALIFNQIK